MRVLLLILSGSVLVTLSVTAEPYRYRDSGGRFYQFDRPADALIYVAETHVAAAKSPSNRNRSGVLVRVVKLHDEHYFFVLNRLTVPVALIFRFLHHEPLSIPSSLQGPITIPSATEHMVGKLRLPNDYRYEFAYQPQVATTQPKGDAFINDNTPDLASPIKGRYLISQGFNGHFSHNKPANRYALDIALPIGTPLYATKAGVVVAAVDHYAGGGLASKYRGKANYLRIRHLDGTMTLYAHLDTQSLLVKQGQQVQQGQRVAASGHTGYSSGPHLHLALQREKAGSRKSIPFTIQGQQPLAGRWLSEPELGVGAQN